jgi:hypothetical protein
VPVSRLDGHPEKDSAEETAHLPALDSRLAADSAHFSRGLLSPGDEVGGYRVVSQVGAGSYGKIYLVERAGLGRRFALKLLPDPGRESLIRFEREASLASRLDDPGIVSVFDVGRHGPHPYYVMEYCPGDTLADRLKKGPLPLKQAVTWTLALARTLARAHAAGILHRDLKPANVLLPEEEQGQPRLTDFGLARSLDSRSLTQTGDFLGTPYYVAPEQAIDAKRSDARADVYSLGVMFYECLTGERPFTGLTAIEVLQKARQGPTPAPSALRPEVPPALDRICCLAMARDPGERTESARDLATSLEAFLERKPGARPRRSRRWLALAAIAVPLLAGLGAWKLSDNRAPPAATPAPVASAPAATPTQPLPADPQGVLREARALVSANMGHSDHERVEALLSDYLRARPEDTTAKILRASCRWSLGQDRGEHELGQLNLALGQRFTELLDDLPAEWRQEVRRAALSGMGVRLPAPDALRPQVERWVSKVPEVARSLLEAAILGAACGKSLRDVRADLLAAGRLASGSLPVAMWRARLLVGRDAYALAQTAIGRARGLATGSEHAAARAELARLEADLIWRGGNLHDSPPAWRRVHELDPTGPDGQVALAQAWFLERHEAQAGKRPFEQQALVRKVLEKHPTHSRARALEVLFTNYADPYEAMRCADAVLAAEGCLDSQLLSFRAFAFSSVARPHSDLIRREWEVVLRVTEGCYHRIGASGTLSAFTKEVAWVERTMRECARLEPKRAHVHEYLGLAYLLSGREADSVLAEWKKAHALEPRNGIQRGFLGLFVRRFGRTPAFEELFAKLPKKGR